MIGGKRLLHVNITRPLQFLRRIGLSRFQSTSNATTASSASLSSEAAQSESGSISSCKEGTILSGLNILKGGKDPVALADSEYPSWLWTLLKPRSDFPRKSIRDARNRHIKEVNSRKRKS